MRRTFFSHLACSACRTTYDPHDRRSVCERCGQTLLAQYDLDEARRHCSPEAINGREGSLWRYRELLPLFDDHSMISLGEGWTPMIRASRLGESLGLRSLFIKEEGYNPTGSFKARGLCMAVSKAHELAISELAIPSAGNAGGALAAYAAKAGIRAHVFVPKDTPVVNIREAAFFGAEVTLVDGVISDAAKRMNEVRAGTEWFDMSTMKEPYRLEGKKTMGYEVAEQLGWRFPQVILYPTGGGTGLIGMWKAFDEMERLGWVSGRRPRMIAVQTEGCAPIVLAFREHKTESAFWTGAKTVASGLCVPKAFADRLILEALYSSQGNALAVSDHDLLAEMRTVALLEGIFLCPEGAAAVAALRGMCLRNEVGPEETVVLFNTGSGYKYVELFALS
jgi:threonine synthase